jgi:hypothetical protein
MNDSHRVPALRAFSSAAAAIAAALAPSSMLLRCLWKAHNRCQTCRQARAETWTSAYISEKVERARNLMTALHLSARQRLRQPADP